MASITVPDFFPHPLQEVPPAGTVLTETELLERLHSILPPIQALASLLHGAVEKDEVTSRITEPMLSLIFQALYEATVLLDAWYEASGEERLAALHLRAIQHRDHEEITL